MNGAESLVRTAREAGVEICFANPGTTELPLVAALDREPGVRAVLGLFEGVCTGAADGYARMADRPALTLLHLGPGFANGIANLHNARRARSPVVNLIGDHATWHLPYDAPLTSDIVSLASPVSAWVRTSRSSKEMAGDFAEAVAAARRPPGQVATLIAPADCQWDPADGPARPAPRASFARPDADRVEAIARRLRAERRARAAARPRRAARARTARGRPGRGRDRRALLCEVFPTRIERGAGLPRLEKLPYFPEQAQQRLAGCDTVVLAGAREPVSFFGYPGVASRMAPDGAAAVLATPDEDAAAALQDLADALGAPARAPAPADLPLPAAPSGALTPAAIAAALARLQPEGAIVVDEGATSGLAYFPAAEASPPHSYLALTGGRDRPGPSLRDRRRHRLPAAQGDLAPGRRQRLLHAPGALDPGPRAARRR